MIADDITDSLRNWARSEPLVGRLWIFGSRVRGDSTSESDLDVAIELDMSAAKGCDDSGGLATWMLERKGWQKELSRVTRLSVDLQHFDGVNTPTVQRALAEASIDVYTKHS